MRAANDAVADGIASIRRYGFRPVRIAGAVLQSLRQRGRRRCLRTSYTAVIAEPRARATLCVPAVDVPPADLLPSELLEAAAAVRGEAEAVLDHRMDYLGSGPVDLGSEIDWHRDFKSGYRWPSIFYQDLEMTRLHDHSDAKVPWELSRGHQLLTLARAARLYEDERFAVELEAQLTSWLDANPPGYGINWVTSMELAFRAINWVWAIGTLEGWRPLDSGLRTRVTRSLQVHGRHIALHLEGSPLLRGNHYLADVIGLLALAASLPDDPDAAGWRRFSRRELERQIRNQVFDDGVGFEASLPYHGLSLEMFIVAWYVEQQAGRALSASYRRRLERMIEVSRSVRHPDGRSPVFGDQDSGRLLPGGFARPPTHQNLLDLGAAVLGLPRQCDEPPHEEVAWTFGLECWRGLAERPIDRRALTAAFPIGGLYILRGGGTHMVVRWGGVGQNGNGGHAHNDLSSYELSRGVPIVVDSGSYLYTADPVARDAFRSTAAHNLLVVDGLDMHPIPLGEPFRMPAHARFDVEQWRETNDKVVLGGSHDGFRRPGQPMRCRRRIALNRDLGTVEVTDEADGAGMHTVESLIHLAPGCVATTSATDMVVVRSGATVVQFEFTGATSVSVEQGWVSSQYGVREEAPMIRASVESELPATIAYRVVPV